MKRNGRGRKLTRSNSYHHGICTEGLRKTTKILDRIIGAQTGLEPGTPHIYDTCNKRYGLSKLTVSPLTNTHKLLNFQVSFQTSNRSFHMSNRFTAGQTQSQSQPMLLMANLYDVVNLLQRSEHAARPIRQK